MSLAPCRGIPVHPHHKTWILINILSALRRKDTYAGWKWSVGYSSCVPHLDSYRIRTPRSLHGAQLPFSLNTILQTLSSSCSNKYPLFPIALSALLLIVHQNYKVHLRLYANYWQWSHSVGVKCKAHTVNSVLQTFQAGLGSGNTDH